MIGLIGIRKNTPLEIREKFIVKSKKYNEYFEELLKELNEVVILATCNRTEIYFNASLNEPVITSGIKLAVFDAISNPFNDPRSALTHSSLNNMGPICSFCITFRVNPNCSRISTRCCAPKS